MCDYKIEKNIPVGRTGSGVQKYPFSDMEVGDSFVCDKHEIANIYNASMQYGRRNSMKFSRRKINGDKFRLWRIK